VWRSGRRHFALDAQTVFTDRAFLGVFTIVSSHARPPPRQQSTMADTDNKENIADGLFANGSFKAPAALSPRKSSRKTRSKSIGPGGLGELEAPALKETAER
jgi:hypothetical protein